MNNEQVVHSILRYPRLQQTKQEVLVRSFY